MARRYSPLGHVRCLCGLLCPVMQCACGNSQFDDRCTWCTWWDQHEPHDTPPYNPASLLESLEFVVDMMNNGSIDSRQVYPEGRYQGD